MDEIVLKKNRGKPISEKDESMLRKTELYKFNMELIENKIIENFPAAVWTNHEDLIQSFSSYLQRKTGRDSGFITKEISRLMGKGCLKIIQKNSSPAIGWV